MPIPGVGAPEFLIILVAALLIFGPSKLPEMMGQAGKALREVRKMTSNLTGDFEKSLNDAAGTDVRKTLSQELAGIKGEVEGVGKTVQGTVNKGVGATSSRSTTSRSTASKTTTGRSTSSTRTATTVKPATSSTTRTTGTGSRTTTSAKSTTSSTSTASKRNVAKAVEAPAPPPVATKVDPLSDVSLLDDSILTPEKPARRGRAAARTTTTTTTTARPAAAKPAAAKPIAIPNVDLPSATPKVQPAANFDPFARVRQQQTASDYQSAAS